MEAAGHEGNLEAAQALGQPNATLGTWTAIAETRRALAKLWADLFHKLAAEAGLPAPATVQIGIAAYAEKRHADALASYARDLLRMEPSQFRVGKAKDIRHCVSLSGFEPAAES